MKKILLAFCLLLIVSCLFPWKVKASILSGVLPKTQIIYSDSSYTAPTNNFSTGQTVYIKIENSGCGCSQKTLRVLDNNKNEISKLELNRTGSGPYVFSVSFSAPSAEGIYYVDIKIEGSGSSYSNQQNINVTAGDSSPTQIQTPTVTLNPTPTDYPVPANQNFFQRFWELLQDWLTGLTNKR